jgi:GNAT superfamily N-acetyltransferase
MQVDIFHPRPRHFPAIRAMLRATWVHTYAPIMGEAEALADARRLFRANIFKSVYQAVKWRLLGLHVAELVAAVDEVVIGHAGYSIETDGHVVLWMLYVAPDFQGYGIGSQLLEAIEASAPDAKSIRLEVLQGNTPAIAWYRRRGFETFHSQPRALGGTPLPVFYMDRPGAMFRNPSAARTSTPKAFV